MSKYTLPPNPVSVYIPDPLIVFDNYLTLVLHEMVADLFVAIKEDPTGAKLIGERFHNISHMGERIENKIKNRDFFLNEINNLAT